jgi:hypothetical protein
LFEVWYGNIDSLLEDFSKKSLPDLTLSVRLSPDFETLFLMTFIAFVDSIRFSNTILIRIVNLNVETYCI